MRHRVSIVAATLSALALSIPAAQAKEVRFPSAHPEVSLNVPEDWSVVETSLGLELQPPGKDALVVAGVTTSDRKSVDDWSKQALERMGTEGVVFAKKGSARTAAKVAAPDMAIPEAPKPAPAMPASATPAPATQNPEAPKAADKAADAAAEMARLNGDRRYTFAGAPTIEPPKIVSEDQAPVAGHSGDVDLPTISSVATVMGNPGAMKPSGHFAYAGGALRGQPVDVELAVFPLGKDKRLLIEQLSGPTDARGVMIVRSLRDLDLTR